MERRKSRSTMLNAVSTNSDLLSPNGFVPKDRRRKQPFISHLVSLRNWIKEKSDRARSPHSKSSSGLSPKTPMGGGGGNRGKSPDLRRLSTANRSSVHMNTLSPTPSHPPPRPRVSTHGSGSVRRLSASPAPLTPRSSYRRSSRGLRFRKSTSSSVSSIRSMPHHQHSHSKASSTSSVSIASPTVSVSGHSNQRVPKSPHNSIKVLPATPTSTTFPSNLRLVRAGFPTESTAAFGSTASMAPQGPGFVFAKRKRSPFKGPMLSVTTSSSSSMQGGNAGAWRSRSGGEAASRTTSVQGRRSGEILGITEEDEEEEVEEEEGVEVVDFKAALGAGEVVVEEGEEEGRGARPCTPPANHGQGEQEEQGP